MNILKLVIRQNWTNQKISFEVCFSIERCMSSSWSEGQLNIYKSFNQTLKVKIIKWFKPYFCIRVYFHIRKSFPFPSKCSAFFYSFCSTNLTLIERSKIKYLSGCDNKVLHLPRRIVIINNIVVSCSRYWIFNIRWLRDNCRISGICNIFEGTVLREDSRNNLSASLKSSCISENHLCNLR